MTRHVLLYTDDPGMGGIAHYNHALLMALAAAGHRVTCVQSVSDNPMVEERKQSGIHHEWLYFDTAQDFGRTFSNGSDAQEIFSKLKPDLIIFSDICPISNFAAKQMARDYNIPYLIVIGLVAPSPSYHFGEGLNPAAYLDKLAQQFGLARAVIVVSQNSLNLLHQQFQLEPELGRVIYYGCPDPFFAPRNPATRDRLRREMGIPEEGVVCLTTARLEAVKGFHYQLDAILHLRERPIWDSLYFVWLGDGTLYDWIHEAIAEEDLNGRVKLLGQRWDVADWLDAADLFVLPSEIEGMPLALIEAMAKGVPAIASAVGGVVEALGDTGRLLPNPVLEPQATVDALVEAIQELATADQTRVALGQAARSRADQLFRQSRMLEETLAQVRQVLDTLPVPPVETPPVPDDDLPEETPEIEESPAPPEPLVEQAENLEFEPGDYVSPGYLRVNVDRAFPHLSSRWEEWQTVAHRRYSDQRWPDIPLLSRDEAHILYNTAIALAGKPALEIGSRLGWSTCHLALGGVELDVVDPALTHPALYAQVMEALAATGTAASVTLTIGSIPKAVEPLAAQRRWALIVINGDYTAPAPLQTAIACENWAAPDALILMLNAASPDVAQGLDYLRQRGWQTQIYQTLHIIGVAWRGAVQPIAHQPDPAIGWQTPSHLTYYRIAASDSAQASASAQATPAQQVQDLMRQAIEQYNSGQPDDALESVEQAAALGITVPELHYLRSFCLTAVGRYPEALEAAKAELAINPNHKQAKEQVERLVALLAAPPVEPSAAPPSDRHWRSDLPDEMLLSIHQAAQKHTYRSLPLAKNPFDLALYPLLLWTLKPRTIIELGSNGGGSALWLTDLLNNFGLNTHIYSVDRPRVSDRAHPQVTYLEGDRSTLAQSFTAGWLSQLPHPWLIIYPAHSDQEATVQALEFFHAHMQPDDYCVVEAPILLEFAQPETQLNHALQRFLANHTTDYEIDSRYCDYFGYNVTTHINGYLRKLAPTPAPAQPAPSKDKQQQKASTPDPPSPKPPTQAPPAQEPVASTQPASPPTSEPIPDLETAILDSVGLPTWDELVDLVEQCDSPLAIGRLRRIRQHLAYHWLGLPADELQTDYQGVLGRAQRLLMQSCLQHEPLTASEQSLSQEIMTYLKEGLTIPGGLQHLIAGMLYMTSIQLPVKPDVDTLPQWLQPDILAFLNQASASD